MPEILMMDTILLFHKWENYIKYHRKKRLHFFLGGVFFFFRATPMAYGSSQARGQIRAAAAGLHHSHSQIQAAPATYTTAHGNARSLTHRVRPGIEPTTSCFLVGFISTVPQQRSPACLWLLTVPTKTVWHSLMIQNKYFRNRIKLLKTKVASQTSGKEEFLRTKWDKAGSTSHAFSSGSQSVRPSPVEGFLKHRCQMMSLILRI